MEIKTAKNGEKITDVDTEKPEAGKFRTILPQVLATTVKNILLLDLGLAYTFNTIVIPALTGQDKVNNADEFIHISAEEASWLASLASICQMVGALCSGILAGRFGRKRAMFIVNLPHVAAWIMMYYSTSLKEIFAATVLLGLGTGLMEAPTVTYIGEITQPSIRGTLTAFSGVACTLGFFIVFLLGSVMPWRTVAIICLVTPITVLIAICFVPETPQWLLSKQRTEEALKSLQWLRGWVSPKAVEKEFQELQRYSENASACGECQKQKIPCSHPPPTVMEKLIDLKRKRVLKPISLILFLYSSWGLTGSPMTGPYQVVILNAYSIPITGNWAATILSIIGLVSTVLLVCFVKILGKRFIILWSLFITFVTLIALAIYGFFVLPAGAVSLGDDAAEVALGNNYFPLFAFSSLTFFRNLSGVIPWMMMSEVLPFNSRVFGAGFTACIFYFMIFVANKTYLYLESSLSIPGVTMLFGVMGVFVYIVTYFIMPETENRTLEEIELHYSDNSRKMTDIYIRKFSEAKDSHPNNIEIGTISQGLDNKSFNRDN